MHVCFCGLDVEIPVSAKQKCFITGTANDFYASNLIKLDLLGESLSLIMLRLFLLRDFLIMIL